MELLHNNTGHGRPWTGRWAAMASTKNAELICQRQRKPDPRSGKFRGADFTF